MADEDAVEGAEELPNASTEEGVRKQRLTAKLRQQQEAAVIAQLLSTAPGRKFYYDIVFWRSKNGSKLGFLIPNLPTKFSKAMISTNLVENHGVNLQIGGSDHVWNMVAGTDLIRKKSGNETHVITVPLITDSTGKKFGKSEGNAVWLDADKTSRGL